MMIAHTIVAVFLVSFVSEIGAHRFNDVSAAENDKSEDQGSAETMDFCASARCSGVSDLLPASKKALRFRSPHAELNAAPLGRDQIAAEMGKGYEGYHHGVLKDCQSVVDTFSDSRDWAEHMQDNLRMGIWPNQPGDDIDYKCAEKCKLKIFNTEGVQLNKGLETDVWVERAGIRRDPLHLSAKGTCMVGTALQEHWWKQKFAFEESKKQGQPIVMEDQTGLPVWPGKGSELVADFEKKFCGLETEQKGIAIGKYTKHRPNPLTYGMYYGEAMGKLRRNDFFPEGFPESCPDGWRKAEAGGVTRD